LGDVIYVDANAAPGGDGLTWGTAYKYLQDALYKPPTSGDEIWVAAGIYKPDQDEGGNVTAGDRMATFELKNGVSVYGGFPIGGGTWEERDPNLYETFLSGDLNGDDEPNFANYVENSYHVISGSSITGLVTIDGVIVTAGNATGATVDRGAGMYLDYSSPNIMDCTFTDNDGSLAGGGIYIYAGSPIVEKCRFEQNRADYGGGVCSLRPVYDGSKPIFNNCTFIQNISEEEGGGIRSEECTVERCIFVRNGAKEGGGIYFVGDWDGPFTIIETYPTVINSIFVGNSARRIGGGAICNYVATRPILTNCKFAGNYAFHGVPYANGNGGAVLVDAFNPFPANIYLSVANCSFAGNKADGVGGACAIFCDNIAETTIKNTILWANVDSSGSGEASQVTGGTLIFTSSCIQDDDPNDANIPFGGAANNNIDDNPIFVRDPNDGGDGWGVGDNDDCGDLHLCYNSPCIDAANNTSVPPDTADLDNDGNTVEPTPWDLDANPRFYDDPGTADTGLGTPPIVDMGAFEFQGIPGDFEPDGDVDYNDLDFFTSKWLNTNCDEGNDWCGGADFEPDGDVDFGDYAELAIHWLLGCE
jgi:predicted outer membrane repeat protein